MIKNYLKIAFRNLARDRAFSVLNLVGLAVGLASVIMIMGYVRYELSYDTSYGNHRQVYRLIQQDKPGTVDELRVNVNVGMGPMLQREFPTVLASTEVGLQEVQFKYHNDMVKLNTIVGGADFFKLFNFPFLSGNAATALHDQGNIVLTESAALKFFNDRSPIGKTITDNNGKILHVTGVISDLPLNMHITGEAIISDDSPSTSGMLNMNDYTSLPQYVLLNKNTDAAKLDEQFRSVYGKYKFPAGAGVHLQPVTDIHLRSHYSGEMTPNSDIKYVYIFSSIALLILFIACINYVNLTTARSLQRAREIGLRKVLGALRRQLIIQFLTESFLFFAISTLLAVFIAYIAWPVFSAKITAYQQVLPLFDTLCITGIFAIFLLGGLLSGAYPAFFLSALQPAKVLKGLSKFGVNISLRKALVVLQFTISGILIISTLVVRQQLNYVNDARLGFNKNQLLAVPFSIRHSHIHVFKNELAKNTAIQAVTVASWRVGKDYGSWNNIKDKNDTTKEIRYNFVDADPDFIQTMGIHIIEGRNFSAGHANDMISNDSTYKLFKKLPADEYARFRSSRSVIINKSAVVALGLEHPVGTVLTGRIKGTVIGVIADFNGLSLHEKISPVIISCDPEAERGQMYVRVSPANTQKTIGYMESQWKKFYPDHQFEFAFTDDKLQQLYTADKRLGALFSVFSSLAIVISCLGLFGLISLSVQNRVKEIGIRKVLGASVLDITALISTDFLKLVIASFIVSSPIAWWAMNKWLQDFAYRIQIQWWVFLTAICIALVIALITLSFQSIKAAIANPVKSLRSE